MARFPSLIPVLVLMVVLFVAGAGCVSSPGGGGSTTTTFFSTASTSLRFATSTTSTTLSLEEASLCARKNAVSNDTIIYVHTMKCCNASVNPSIYAVESRGYKIKRIEADKLTASTESLLKCYLPPGMITVPQLICAGTGETKIINRQGAVLEQISGFSENCAKGASVRDLFRPDGSGPAPVESDPSAILLAPAD